MFPVKGYCHSVRFANFQEYSAHFAALKFLKGGEQQGGALAGAPCDARAGSMLALATFDISGEVR